MGRAFYDPVIATAILDGFCITICHQYQGNGYRLRGEFKLRRGKDVTQDSGGTLFTLKGIF